MATDYASAVRAGTMAAGRLHRELNIRDLFEREAGNVDVFGAIHSVGLPLLVRPLNGLLGAFLNEPTPGVLVTTQRRLSIQRFTAAHELGHYLMRHRPSLDDKSILRRMPTSPEPGPDFQETEADAFAVAFMMPKWLILEHCKRQGWQQGDLRKPSVIYQLSLRIGASYEATCRTLLRYQLISLDLMQGLLLTRRRALKVELLGDYRPANYRGDVWLLTERDAGTRIDGSANDVFILRLNEHSGGGYLWDVDQLVASGFVIVGNAALASDAEGIGGPVVRRVTAAAADPEVGNRSQVELEERRPWQPASPAATLSINLDFTGPESGLSRAERRQMLEAA